MLVDFGIATKEESELNDTQSVGKILKTGTFTRIKSMVGRRQSMIDRFNNLPSIKCFKIKDLTCKNKCFDYFQDVELNENKMYAFKPARNHVSYKI